RWRDAVADEDSAALKQLTAEAQQASLSAVALQLLGQALEGRGALDEAVAVLRHAQRSHPADFWIHFQLAQVLLATRHQGPGRLEEAIGCYRAALALRPRAVVVSVNLGSA